MGDRPPIGAPPTKHSEQRRRCSPAPRNERTSQDPEKPTSPIGLWRHPKPVPGAANPVRKVFEDSPNNLAIAPGRHVLSDVTCHRFGEGGEGGAAVGRQEEFDLVRVAVPSEIILNDELILLPM